jgi:hypothetical protein
MRLCHFDHHNCNHKHHDKECPSGDSSQKNDEDLIVDKYDKLIPRVSSRSKSLKPELTSRQNHNDCESVFSTRSYDKDKSKELDREKEIERMIEAELQLEREKLKVSRRSRTPRNDPHLSPFSELGNPIPNLIGSSAPPHRARSRSRPRGNQIENPNRSKKITDGNPHDVMSFTAKDDPSVKPRVRNVVSKDNKEHLNSQSQVKFQVDEQLRSQESDSPQDIFTEMSFDLEDTKTGTTDSITIEEKKVRPRTLREIKDQSLINPAIILEKVDTLPIYKYTYKGGGKKFAMGPLPQDWHQAFPTNKDMQVLDPQDMSAVSLASIKALSQMVSTIWQTVLSLNTRLEALENINSRLETLEANSDSK